MFNQRSDNTEEQWITHLEVGQESIVVHQRESIENIKLGLVQWMSIYNVPSMLDENCNLT